MDTLQVNEKSIMEEGFKHLVEGLSDEIKKLLEFKEQLGLLRNMYITGFMDGAQIVLKPIGTVIDLLAKEGKEIADKL